MMTVKTNPTEVNVNLQTDTVELEDDLSIDQNNLTDSYIDQPAKFAFWATLCVQAKSKVDAKKIELDKHEEYWKKQLCGELDGKVRMEMEVNGEKITESKVTAAIPQHPDYQAAAEHYYELKTELAELQADWAALEVAKEALNQRKEMLISLGAHIRMEVNNLDLTLKEKASEVVGSRKRKAIKTAD